MRMCVARPPARMCGRRGARDRIGRLKCAWLVPQACRRKALMIITGDDDDDDDDARRRRGASGGAWALMKGVTVRRVAKARARFPGSDGLLDAVSWGIDGGDNDDRWEPRVYEESCNLRGGR